MKTYVILFRGINVGGNNLLPMKALKPLLVNLGYEQVQSYIQSGNVVLNSHSAPLKAISEMVSSNFGFSPDILTLEKKTFEKALAENPFKGFEGKTVHFYFCIKSPELDVSKLDALAAGNEKYKLKDRVFYLHAPDGIGRSKIVSNIEACLGSSATGRNLNTVLKLSKILNSDVLVMSNAETLKCKKKYESN